MHVPGGECCVQGDGGDGWGEGGGRGGAVEGGGGEGQVVVSVGVVWRGGGGVGNTGGVVRAAGFGGLPGALLGGEVMR